jgi:hypothetical protein
MALLVIVLNYDLQADQNEILSASTSRTIYEGTRQVLELKQQQQEDNNIKYREMPDAIRAIYISSWIAGTPSLRNNLISFIENSEINSVIIDIKDSTGVISFPLNEPLVNQYHSPSIRIRDIEALLKKLHEKNIYVIGRLTAFQDPALAKKHPELALKRIDNGEIWKDKKGLAFINPKKEAAWEYLVAIAKESYKMGFNEINFDYIRYPSDGNISNINYDLDDGEKRSDIMKKFYQYLDKNLREQNIPISADVFGLTTTAQDDLGIGQIFEDILPYFDAVAPMVYPSHYSSGFFGFNNPEAHPYEVVYTAMNSGYTRAVSMGEDPQKLRPWIQDFSLGLPYGQKEVKDQIRAIYDSGLDSYMVWDPKNKYTKEAYTGNID